MVGRLINPTVAAPVQDSLGNALSLARLMTKGSFVNSKIIHKEVGMKFLVSMLMATILILFLSASTSADNSHKTHVAQLLEYSTSLQLTDSQIRKLEIIEKTAVRKMIEAKLQADIRLNEIEKFTSNWTNMNGTAVRGLLREYYDFLTEYKTAEINAVIQARTILDYEQLNKYQQLVSIQSLILNMEQELAAR
jgi:hypothetical protein